MAAAGHIPDFCLVGEPTNPSRLGEVIKIGRRGSLPARVTSPGVQGHAAYPHLADNPVHRLIHVLNALIAAPLDAGTEWFEPSSLQVTSIDVGNPAANVIPGSARALLNIRFNDLHTIAGLQSWLGGWLGQYVQRFDLDVSVSGEPFLTAPGPEVEKLRSAIAQATGIEPRFDTGGGTSDARFVAKYCKVAEFGLVGATMHHADERVALADLALLTEIYRTVLTSFLG